VPLSVLTLVAFLRRERISNMARSPPRLRAAQSERQRGKPWHKHVEVDQRTRALQRLRLIFGYA
jgi:hypothetical protein